MRMALTALSLLLWTTSVAAQEPAPVVPEQACKGTCVPNEDMQVFVQVLRDKQCQQKTKPEFKLDPVVIVVDKQGRVYGSGSSPKPYKLSMKWCNYEIQAEGQVTIVAAQRVEPDWGFRFRPKASFGFLPVTALKEKNVVDGLDGGVLLEPFYFHWLNVNGYVGVRSAGGGLGVDITKNMGGYLGYSITWGTWVHNPFAAISFALW
jgi:hypothetical protein